MVCSRCLWLSITLRLCAPLSYIVYSLECFAILSTCKCFVVYLWSLLGWLSTCTIYHIIHALEFMFWFGVKCGSTCIDIFVLILLEKLHKLIWKGEDFAYCFWVAWVCEFAVLALWLCISWGVWCLNLNLGFAFWLHIPGGALEFEFESLNLEFVLWLYISGGALEFEFEPWICIFVAHSRGSL